MKRLKMMGERTPPWGTPTPWGNGSSAASPMRKVMRDCAVQDLSRSRNWLGTPIRAITSHTAACGTES